MTDVADAMRAMDLRGQTHKYSKIYDRVPIEKVLRTPSETAVGSTVIVGGWVKTGREAEKGALLFLALNDGSGPGNLQVIVQEDVSLSGFEDHGTRRRRRRVERAPPESAKGQAIEMHATKILMCGKCDGAVYPISKKKQTLEFLRGKDSLATWPNTIAAWARVRSALAYATHTFFNQNGFLYVHTPCITQSDCEGAGEMFQVTTLLAEAKG